MKHTMQELKEWQCLPLFVKVRMTENRIRGWINEFGQDGVYVSFSGGKDSTVLLDIVRNMGYDRVPAVFVDVPTQYPELKEFVKTFDNVVILYPKISFMKVCEKYGFPLISKEVSAKLSDWRSAHEHGRESYVDKQFEGTYMSKNGKVNLLDIQKYAYLKTAPFNISHKCCSVMKKDPVHKYSKQTGRMPITAQMADESMLRTQNWLKNGCNAFDAKNPISNPMSFWTENDVLEYIVEHNLPICSVYGDVVEDYGNQVEGQLSFVDYKKKYKTTGCQRTGCMLCGFGCHLEKSPNRFELLKKTHPKMYNMLDVVKNNGVTMREAIEWLNEHGNTNIKL